MQHPGPARGWTDSRLELLKIRLLDLVQQNAVVMYLLVHWFLA